MRITPSFFRRTRRNHALEHGTVAILLGKGASPPLGGYSVPGGFFVFSREADESVVSAASEALQRLQTGESELAVSPYCGSNLVVGAVIAGLLSGLIMQGPRRRMWRLPLVAAAGVVAALLGRPIGQKSQRRYTTLADQRGVEITGVRGIGIGRSTIHWVSTRNR